jgi:SWI/SNF-related matrix-associated actin-dependent regulator of chromatin subfamily A-like protein 1
VLAPFPYQEAAATWLAERRAGALLDDPGLGKTLSLILAADRISAVKVNVVCPAIARPVWRDHFQNCQQLARKILVLESSRDVEHVRDADVCVCGYELLTRPRVRNALRDRGRSLLILDEAHRLKTPDAACTKAAYGREGLISNASRCWPASGTITPNAPHEWWTHARALFKSTLTYEQHVSRYCATRAGNFGTQITGANPARLAELAAFLKPHVLRRAQRDVLQDLPALLWGLLPVSPGDLPPQRDLTREQEAILGKLERDEALTLTEQMHLATLLRFTGLAKAPAVVELVRDEIRALGKLVIFAWHTDVIDALKAGLEDIAAVIDGRTPQRLRQSLIEQFQQSTWPQILILQIRVAGTAITLTAASHCVFAESSWVPSDMAQAAKRLHRIGQTSKVSARVVALSGSVDERVNAIVTKKARDLAMLDGLLTGKVAA